VGTNVPSLRTFFEILSGNYTVYDSDNIDYHSPCHLCFHINGDGPIDNPPKLMLPY
jgi:hypothetical protein